MKEFMLIYKGGDPDWLATATPEEMGATMEKWNVWMGNLQEKEQLVSGGSPLNYGGKRLDHDGVVTDISTPEFKELVSGYSIIMADDMDAAVKIARDCPIFCYPGTKCEVREVMNMDG